MDYKVGAVNFTEVQNKLKLVWKYFKKCLVYTDFLFIQGSIWTRFTVLNIHEPRFL